MSVAYLEKLNPEQRRAVEHGVREKDFAGIGAFDDQVSHPGPKRMGHDTGVIADHPARDPLDAPRHLGGGPAREGHQHGLNPAFTIHDREDSADLMNLMRHELGFSKTENRFPAKGKYGGVSMEPPFSSCSQLACRSHRVGVT